MTASALNERIEEKRGNPEKSDKSSPNKALGNESGTNFHSGAHPAYDFMIALIFHNGLKSKVSTWSTFPLTSGKSFTIPPFTLSLPPPLHALF